MAGLAAIAVALLLYLMNVKAYINYSDLLGWVVLTVGIVMGGLAVRKENEGFLPFKEALKTTFLIWVVGSFLVMVFKYALFNFIDPGLVDIQIELVMENMEKLGGLMGEASMEALMAYEVEACLACVSTRERQAALVDFASRKTDPQEKS